MRRITTVIVSLVYLLSLLAACSAPPQPTEPLEEATDKLVVYFDSRNSLTLEYAINKFKTLYRDVDLEVRTFGDMLPESFDNYVAALRTDLMTGAGPDVVVLRRNVLPDIYKAMGSGIFDDLNPYLDNDLGEGDTEYGQSINLADYNQSVLDAGLFEGKRYVMPLCYSFPFVVSTETLMSANGLPTDGSLTLDQFLSGLRAFADANGTTPFTQRNLQLGSFLNFSGLELVDYENGRANVDVIRSDDLRNIVDTYKSYYAYDTFDTGDETEDADKLIAQERLFTPSYEFQILSYFFDCSMITYKKDVSVVSAIKDVNGDVVAWASDYAAIPAASENKANAWRFIKILLSPIGQGEPGYYISNFPVLNGNLQKHYEWNLASEYGGPSSTRYYNNMQFPTEYFAPREAFGDFYRIIGTVDRAVLESPQISDFLWEAMKPYLDNNKDYDSCLNDLINRLELYAAE